MFRTRSAAYEFLVTGIALLMATTAAINRIGKPLRVIDIISMVALARLRAWRWGERSFSFANVAKVARVNQLPNMRLKLTGLTSRELLRCLAGRAPRRGRVPCAGAHVARSLSAIR